MTTEIEWGATLRERHQQNVAELLSLQREAEALRFRMAEMRQAAMRNCEMARTRCAEMQELRSLTRGGSRRPVHVGHRPVRPSASTEADREIDALHREYAATRDPGLRDQLVRHYDDLALSLVRQFRTRREAFDDLLQVARIGLIHAIDRFDPDRGRPFGGFARVTITGELKRHVRDKTWSMRVPRSLQEHYLAVVRAADDLTAQLGRSPRIPEIADACGLSEEEVIEATDLGRRQRPMSFDVPDPEGVSRPIEPGATDPGLEGVENRSLVASLIRRLPERERTILELRFVEGMTQQEIAEQIGMSQMYVSRLLGRILERMRIVAGGT